MQLTDDDALGTVDDEGARLGHERDLAEVDLLLLDVAHDPLPAVAGVVDHELCRDLDRRREGHAALTALLDVVLGLLEVVADEDELARPVEVLDGEDAAEHRLQTYFHALVRRDGSLEKLVVGGLLDIDEIRDFDHSTDSTEVLADSEVTLDNARHLDSCSLRDLKPLAQSTRVCLAMHRLPRGNSARARSRERDGLRRRPKTPKGTSAKGRFPFRAVPIQD